MDEDILRQASGENWNLYNGDCVDIARMLPDNSVGLSIFSPPYRSLYVYSDSIRDMGNSRTSDEFYEHFGYLIAELMRVTKPGRIVAVDCMNIPAMKERDGYIGLHDFRGDLIRQFQSAGFIFHSEHCMWKDPLLEAVRTKALGLMHKQLCKDSAMCRAGIPQYLLAFRKPGANEERVFHENGLDYFIGENEPGTDYSLDNYKQADAKLQHERWRRYASPVWMDINFGNTLNHKTARGENDERHICPMSMDIIGRGIQLWSNPNDVVFDPFAGVGSTGYVALEMGRKSIGIELKESYFNQNKKNLESVVVNQGDLELTLF